MICVFFKHSIHFRYSFNKNTQYLEIEKRQRVRGRWIIIKIMSSLSTLNLFQVFSEIAATLDTLTRELGQIRTELWLPPISKLFHFLRKTICDNSKYYCSSILLSFGPIWKFEMKEHQEVNDWLIDRLNNKANIACSGSWANHPSHPCWIHSWGRPRSSTTTG